MCPNTNININSTNTDSKLALVCENEYDGVPKSQQVESYLQVVGLRAPAYESDETQARTAMDLVAVLDRSGSMAGAKLRMVHETCKLLIDQCKDADRLALVAYDDSVETVLQLTRMDKAGKAAAKKALATINDRGCTNLSGGLWRGIELLGARGEGKNEVASVLLMTDGLANRGVTEPGQVVAETRTRLQALRNPTSIYTFGFGADHSSTLLSNISEASQGGTYYFMKTTDSIPTAFADCFGGLASTVAQNIRVTIKAAAGVTINAVTSGFEQQELVPRAEYSLQMGDLFSEEERDVLVDIKLPAAATAGDTPTLYVTLRATNVITCASESEEMTVTVRRTDGTAMGAASAKVDIERNRLRTVQAMQAAQTRADAGDLAGARGVIEQHENAVMTSISAPMCAGQLQDLQSVKMQMQSASLYRSEGAHRMRNKAKKHMMQRACEADDDDECEQAAYMTSSKVKTKSAWKSNFFSK